MSDARPTILFVGESPPAGAPPDFRPFDCASGSRLAKALGLVDREALLANVPFTNIFPTPTGVNDCPRWDRSDARVRGLALREQHQSTISGRAVFVALGARTQDALGVGNAMSKTWVRERTDAYARDIICVPHPSGQHQGYNTDEAKQEIRRTILPDLCAATNVSLRPWHFRLEEPAVLADLGLALCPLEPALGAAAAIIYAETWRARSAPAGVELKDYHRQVDRSLAELQHDCMSGDGHLANAIGPHGVSLRSMRSEVSSRRKFAARTLPRPPSAEVRAAYARLVALGVA
jgi:uracil-DNA glycosylase